MRSIISRLCLTSEDFKDFLSGSGATLQSSERSGKADDSTMADYMMRHQVKVVADQSLTDPHIGVKT